MEKLIETLIYLNGLKIETSFFNLKKNHCD